MSITATEYKMNLGKYLTLSQTEDVYITRNGKVVAKLSDPNQNKCTRIISSKQNRYINIFPGNKLCTGKDYVTSESQKYVPALSFFENATKCSPKSLFSKK